MRKIICYIIWFILVCIGAITRTSISDNLQYLYGFIFGSICLGALQIAQSD